MSTSAADPNKSSFHRRNDSGELDVFEAARYFSNAVDQAAHINGVRHHMARRSLDVPVMMRSNPHHYIIDQKQLMKDDNKKMKQPSSPGGRLASFLNSLFNQTSAKKKKSKSAAAKELEEESPSGRRKRRSSISHFRITTGTSKGSGLRSANTPAKPYKELARFAEHNAISVGEKKGVECEKIAGEEDDGGESDSSSDLFDLPNHDLDFFPTGLPVYGTTRIHTITIPAPIPSAT